MKVPSNRQLMESKVRPLNSWSYEVFAAVAVFVGNFLSSSIEFDLGLGAHTRNGLRARPREKDQSQSGATISESWGTREITAMLIAVIITP